jgi:hypothetical protein
MVRLRDLYYLGIYVLINYLAGIEDILGIQ